MPSGGSSSRGLAHSSSKRTARPPLPTINEGRIFSDNGVERTSKKLSIRPLDGVKVTLPETDQGFVRLQAELKTCCNERSVHFSQRDIGDACSVRILIGTQALVRGAIVAEYGDDAPQIPVTATVKWGQRLSKPNYAGPFDWTKEGFMVLQPTAGSAKDAELVTTALRQTQRLDTARTRGKHPKLSVRPQFIDPATLTGLNTNHDDEPKAYQDAFMPAHADNAIVYHWHWDCPGLTEEKEKHVPLSYFYLAMTGNFTPSPPDEYIEVVVKQCTVNPHAVQSRAEGVTVQPFR